MTETTDLIRPARQGDGEAIVRLFRRAMRPSLLPLTVYGTHGAADYLEDLFKRRDPNQASQFFVGVTGSNVTAGIEIRRMASHLFVNHIYVDPEHQGRRLGSHLLRLALIQARDRRHFAVRLDTESDNKRALEWYRRLGLNVKRTYALWLITPPEGGCGADACKSNMKDPEIEAQYLKYGFCQFELRTSTGSFEAGMLGKKLFRIADEELLLDRKAMAFFREMDPKRKILFAGMLPEAVHAARTERILEFGRMEGSISSCLRYLQSN